MATLANAWVVGVEGTSLVTFTGAEQDHYPIDPRIHRYVIGEVRMDRPWLLRAYPQVARLRRLRRVLRDSKPDAIVSFIDKMNVLAIVASLGLDIPIYVSERTNPRRHEIGPMAKLLRWIFYRLATGVVVQTEEVAEWATGFLPRHRVHVIPNPVLPVDDTGAPEIPLPAGPCLVALGRLVTLKGFHLLIAAFARLADQCPNWSLVIVGDGPERPRLAELVVQSGLDERVRLVGSVRTPASILTRCELFVLTSTYEGFPNALLEAMAAGLPAVSFDCPVGPSSIIRHGIDGLLVPPGDVDALVCALRELMVDHERRRTMARHARSVTDRFSLSSVLTMWSQVLDGKGAVA